MKHDVRVWRDGQQRKQAPIGESKKSRGVPNSRAWAVEMRKRPCHYCGAKPPSTVDHKIAVSVGGRTTPENCVPACMKCQNLKGTMDYWRFIEFLKRLNGEPPGMF